MKIIADTHLHFYPCYDTGKAFSCLTGTLAALSEGAAVQVGFMAERYDCDFYSRLLSGSVETGGEFELRAATDGTSVSVRRTGSRQEVDSTAAAHPPVELFLLPGRQVVTMERLEILALATPGPIPDGLPAAEVVEKTLALDGVPVLAWAPGKWFFRRGEVVRELIERFDPKALLIGDSSLRPGIWSEPLLMKTARKKGFRVVAGSDPLPFRGEESAMGTYASSFDGTFDPCNALISARELLLGPSSPAPAGRRGGLLKVLLRLWKNARA